MPRSFSLKYAAVESKLETSLLVPSSHLPVLPLGVRAPTAAQPPAPSPTQLSSQEAGNEVVFKPFKPPALPAEGKSQKALQQAHMLIAFLLNH